MRQIIRNSSLGVQLLLLTAICIAAVCAAALFAATLFGWVDLNEVVKLRMTLAVGGVGAGCTLGAAIIIRRLMRPLHELREAMNQVTTGNFTPPPPGALPNREGRQLRETFDLMLAQIRDARRANEESQRILEERSASVNRLLEFSQSVQGAGQSDQVYMALSHYLQKELGLTGLIIATHDPGVLPAITVKVVWPENLLRPEFPLAEMDAALCPCLRQNMPKQFRPDGSPIRCVIDRSISLPATHPAYCIPFHIGRQLQGVVHMAMPPGAQWTKDRRDMAQTYVNAALSSLISLHIVEQAETQSLTDPLTGLFNRHSMERLMQREVALAERHGHAMSLVMVDLDHFKQINDAHGHAAGDHMLKSFADCVRMTLRKTDMAFRYGGDEFVIALPQTPLAQAQQVVQKLRQAFAAVDFSHAISKLENQPTLSIGVAERSKATNLLTLSALLTAADQALYEAKSANRNCVKVYSAPRAA